MNKEKLISINKFAEITGLSTQTLRRWDNNGKLKAYKKLESGKRFYIESQLDEVFTTKFNKPKEDKIIIGYCRVSSNKQKDDLERQIENMTNYLMYNGKPFKIISDIGSGINYNKKGLNEIINLVISNKVEKIVVLYKDRLIRFGFELIENICSRFNTKIEIVDQTKKTDEEELVEDMIQIVTVFSARLQGKRANKAKKMIKELVNVDSEKN